MAVRRRQDTRGSRYCYILDGVLGSGVGVGVGGRIGGAVSHGCAHRCGRHGGGVVVHCVGRGSRGRKMQLMYKSRALRGSNK